MTDAQMDDLMTLAVNMQREAETDCNRPSAMFAYAVQVAVLEIRETHSKYEELQSQNADLAVQLANAESKCRELAAELSAVDKIHNEAVFITDDHYEQCPPEVQKMIRSLAVLQIPAYDAFLAEVRASAIRDALNESSDYLDTDCVMDRLDINYEDAELRTSGATELHDALVAVANQLRKGE